MLESIILSLFGKQSVGFAYEPYNPAVPWEKSEGIKIILVVAYKMGYFFVRYRIHSVSSISEKAEYIESFDAKPVKYWLDKGREIYAEAKRKHPKKKLFKRRG